MTQDIMPLKIENFLKAALENIEHLRETYIHKSIVQNYMEKTDQIDVGYGSWLKNMLNYVFNHYDLKAKHILDLGCGTGELTVRMAYLGYHVCGLDVHKKHLELGKILAQENGLSSTMFLLNEGHNLPFESNSFDCIVMFSVLEHLDDFTLELLLPEIHRICRGVIYVIVPNRLKLADDHSGLWFVPLMPRIITVNYIKLRGYKYNYHISKSERWDVHYRSFKRIASIFKKYRLYLDFPPEDIIFPPANKDLFLNSIKRALQFVYRKILIENSIISKIISKLGYPKRAFYPYLNLIFIPSKKKRVL